MWRKDTKSKCGSCRESILGFFFNSFIFFFMTGGFLLGFGAVPDFKRYLDEECHHVNAICTFQDAVISEMRDCTYIQSYGPDLSSDPVQSSYPCYQVHVTFKHTNGSVIQAEAFETFEDAEKTDHECATYSCKDPDDIHDLVNDLEGEKTFDCFHHPLKLDYVNIDTANLALLLFSFVCGLLLIIAGFIVLFSLQSYLCVGSSVLDSVEQKYISVKYVSKWNLSIQ